MNRTPSIGAAEEIIERGQRRALEFQAAIDMGATPGDLLEYLLLREWEAERAAALSEVVQ